MQRENNSLQSWWNVKQYKALSFMYNYLLYAGKQ